MTSARMQISGCRLCLGITNFGCRLLAAGAGLLWLEIRRPDAPWTEQLCAIGVGMIATQAVFDFIGDVTLMPGPSPSVMTFLHGWLRGVIGQTLVLSAVGIASAMTGRAPHHASMSRGVGDTIFPVERLGNG